MANTYVTDLRHYLDDSEDLADLPGPALNLAMILTSIVAWATDHEPEDVLPTNVWCWRRPARNIRCGTGEPVQADRRGHDTGALGRSVSNRVAGISCD